MLLGVLYAPGDFLSHGHAHAAHEEAAVQYGEHRLAAVQLADSGHRRIAQSGLFPLGSELAFIAGKVQGVGGGELGPQLLEGEGVQQQRQAEVGSDRQVIPAVGADILRLYQLLVLALPAAARTGLRAAGGKVGALGGGLHGLLPLTAQPVPAGTKQWLHLVLLIPAQQLVLMGGQESCIILALYKVGVMQDQVTEIGGGGVSLNNHLLQAAAHAPDGLQTGGGVDDDLGHQRVIVGRYLIAVIQHGVHTNPGAAGEVDETGGARGGSPEWGLPH